MKAVQLTIVAFILSSVAITCIAGEGAPASVDPLAQPSDSRALADLIDEKFQRADIGSKTWSSAHHTCIFVAVLGATLAAFFTKLAKPADSTKRDNLVAILAAAAALATTLDASLEFNQKWVANRMTRATLDGLRIDVTADDANVGEIRKQFKQTMSRHEELLTK